MYCLFVGTGGKLNEKKTMVIEGFIYRNAHADDFVWASWAVSFGGNN